MSQLRSVVYYIITEQFGMVPTKWFNYYTVKRLIDWQLFERYFTKTSSRRNYFESSLFPDGARALNYKGGSRLKNLCMTRVLSFLIRYFNNYYTLHRSDLAARAAPLEPRLNYFIQRIPMVKRKKLPCTQNSPPQ